MRIKFVLLMLSCNVFCFSCMAADTTILKQDSGTNVSEMDIAFAFAPTYGSAQAVKFATPHPEWILKSVQIMATDGWNKSSEQLPNPLPFAIEIRDANLRLLYHFADTQLPYFTVSEGARLSAIEMPDIPLNGDFFVCFYGYRSIAIAAEMANATNNSFYFDKLTGEVYSGTLPLRNDQTHSVNWIIRVEGE